MKRRLIIAALLTSTAIVAPARAEALPLIGFIQGAAAGIFGTAVLGGTAAAAGFAAGGAVAGFFSTIGGRILLGIGLSLISQALAPKPPVPKPSDYLTNFAQPVSYARFILGRARTGGFLGFTGFQDSTDVVTGTTGAKRHYSPILAAHPCEAVVTHYLDERVVSIDGDGLVTTAPMAGYYRIRPFLGAPGQTADSELVSAFTEVTSSYDFAGLTGAHIWAKRPPQDLFSQIYPSGRQGAYTPVIDGHNGVYDPRGGGSTGHTRNAALLIAFWITEILGQEVDWTEVGTEADICDTLVTNADAGTQPKWRIDGVLSDDQEFEDQRAQMAAACDAWFYEREDGKVGFKVGAYTAPTITLTADDFEVLQISEGTYGRNAPTEVAAQYVEPDYAWREWSSGPYVIDSGTRQVREEPQLTMVSSHNQASRMNKRLAKVKRPKYTLRGTLNLMGYYLRGHRFVRVQALGIDEVFEVGELWRNEGGQTFDLTGNSVESTDFDFNAALEEADRPALAKVVNSDDVPDVTGLSVVPDGRNGLVWSWDASDPAYSQQVRIRPSGDADWVNATVFDVPLGASEYTTSGLATGDAFEGQVRNVTAAKRNGDWKPDTPVEGTVSGTVPDDLSGITLTAAPGRIEAEGTAGKSTSSVRIYRSTGTDFSAAADVSGIIPVSPQSVFAVTAGDGDAVDMISNGGFASSSDWTELGGWAIGGGKATHTPGAGSNLNQNSSVMTSVLVATETYRITFTVLDYTAGNVRSNLAGGGSTAQGTFRSANGTYTEEITALAGVDKLAINADSSFDGSVDDVSLVLDTPDCLPSGLANFWIVPVSAEGVEGTEDGPHSLRIT